MGNLQDFNEILDKNKNWRIIVEYSNSIRGKQAEIEIVIYYLTPDTIILTETNLSNNFNLKC